MSSLVPIPDIPGGDQFFLVMKTRVRSVTYSFPPFSFPKSMATRISAVPTFPPLWGKAPAWERELHPPRAGVNVFSEALIAKRLDLLRKLRHATFSQRRW